MTFEQSDKYVLSIMYAEHGAYRLWHNTKQRFGNRVNDNHVNSGGQFIVESNSIIIYHY